jgi:hypothetical protein
MQYPDSSLERFKADGNFLRMLHVHGGAQIGSHSEARMEEIEVMVMQRHG